MDPKSPVSQAASSLGFALCWLALWIPICFLLLAAVAWFPNFTFAEDVWISCGLSLACAALLRSKKARASQTVKTSTGAAFLAAAAISFVPCYWLGIVLHVLVGRGSDSFYTFWLPIEALVFSSPLILLGFGLKTLFAETPANPE